MIKTPSRTVIIGPFPAPLTGHNIANATVYELLLRNGYTVKKIDTEINRHLDDSIGKWKWYKAKIFLTYLESHKIISSNVIYCSIGQSFLGILKFAPFLLIASILGKQKVVHLHGNALLKNYYQFGFFKKLIAKSTLKMFDKAIVLSESLRDNFAPFLHESKIFTCHNFVDLEEVSEPLVKNDECNLLFLSNLIPAKGILPFLKAIELLNLDNQHFKVHIAGTPSSDYPEILEHIISLPNVVYHGSVQGLKKATLFANADIFCLPTLNQYEGQPLAILEALKYGCYIITSNVKGISDILSNDNGALLWPITADSLMYEIVAACNNKERLNQVRDYNKLFSAKFSIENFEKRIIPLITQ